MSVFFWRGLNSRWTMSDGAGTMTDNMRTIASDTALRVTPQPSCQAKREYLLTWKMSSYPPMASHGGSAHRANTKHLYNICTMLAQRLRRWANIVQKFYNNVLCLQAPRAAVTAAQGQGWSNQLCFTVTPHVTADLISYAVSHWTSVSQADLLTRNGILILGHHLRRWPNIKTTSGQCLVFAELYLDIIYR